MFKLELSADTLQSMKEQIEAHLAEFTAKPDNGVRCPPGLLNLPTAPTVSLNPNLVLSNPVESLPPAPALPVAQPQLPNFNEVAPMYSASGKQIDSKGIEYDEKIHSSGKTFNVDGTWRTRRNLPKDLVTPIAAPAVPPTFIPAVPPTVVAPVATPVVAAPVNYENIPIPAGTKPMHNYGSFKTNIAMVFANLITNNKIDQTYVSSLNKHFGVANIWDVAKNDSQCAELFKMFVEVGFITELS